MASLISRPAQRRRFQPLTVARVEQLTDDAVAVWFAIPQELAAEFRFEPGQYLTVRAKVDGHDVRRSYSICLSRSMALERQELRIAAARVGSGTLSNWINDNLRAGDRVEVMSPLGEFTCATRPDAIRHHVAIVAGSGVTPVMSLFPTLLAEEPASRATLIFGNRQTSSIMFREELDDLTARHAGRFRVIHVLSRGAMDSELLSGRLDRDRIERILADFAPVQTVDEWYLCGPSGLVGGARGLLAALGVDSVHVHHEEFDADEAPDYEV